MKEKIFSAIAAIAITAAVYFALATLSIEVFQSYGGSLFILMPMVCGAISVMHYNRRERSGPWASISVSLIAGCFTLIGFLAMGFEGLICIAMSIPIVLPLFMVGGLIGYALSIRLVRKSSSDVTAIVLIALVPLSLGIETNIPRQVETRSVVTRVVISGSAAQVWNEVIAFSPIPQPEEWLFRMGIAYPTHAEIEGEGVGAIRRCHFSTGSFVEPITHWQENRRLAFDVTEQPKPMTEISPYVNIHPPHLDWAVQSERGEFLLNDLGDGRVELVGTTWYHTVMAPEAYWGWWSDAMIHRIHQRVLAHIKQQVEL